jgi:hypothetical protein
MKKYILLFPAILLYSLSTGQPSRSFVIQPDDITILPANDAIVTNGLKTKPVETAVDPKVFAVQGWRKADQDFWWTVEVPAKALFHATILCSIRGLSSNSSITLEIASENSKIAVKQPNTTWNRVECNDPLLLEAGTNRLQLRMTGVTPNDSPDISVYAIELSTPDVFKKNKHMADSLRSSPDWLTNAKYGLFFHWNSRSMPQKGKPVSYQQAVSNFDVKKFAQLVHETGADFIVLTTGWAEFYFPGPLQSIDKILPGRTTNRDLVKDLSEALAKFNIKLLLYYHFRSDEKETWWKQQQFSPMNTDHLFNNMLSIFSEIGQRYHHKIAGMWIDDGMALYPYNAPFKKLTGAIKAVNKNLVVGYNPWIYPRFTDFQDFYTGESGLTIESAGIHNAFLPAGGNGYYISGPQSGLKATFCGQLEPGDWTHIEANTAIPAPLISADDLIKVVREAMLRKNIPVMNVSVYQDGTISPETFLLLQQLNRAILNGKR